MKNNQPKRYKSSVLKLVSNLFGMMFLGGFLAAMAVYALVSLFDVPYSAMYLLVPVGIVLGILYTIFWKYCWVDVHIDKIVISNLRKKERVFMRHECTFSSNVVTHYTNGIRTEKKRYLVVSQPGKDEEVILPSISKKNFDNLLAALRFSPVEVEKVIQEVDIEKSTYKLPKEQLAKRYYRVAKIFAIVMGAFCSLMVAGMVFFIASVEDSSRTQIEASSTLTWTILFALLLFFGFGIPIFMQSRKKAHMVPAEVSVDRTVLQIDGERFNMAMIEKIVCTPASYINDSFSNGHRTLTISYRNRKYAYIFGDKKPVGKGVFPEYGPMCTAIELSALVNNTPFIFDL